MTLHDVLLTQKRELERILGERYIPRDTSIKGGESDLIKVITGPRRAGKSFFAVHVLDQLGTFGYVNFDDERLTSVTDYDEIISSIKGVFGNPNLLLIDEIQNLSGWELFVNRLQRQGFNLVITGSNSQLLSAELATHLTGRYLQTTILPFSFREYLQLIGKELTSIEKREHLALYAERGGYPEPLTKHLDNRSYLSTLFDAILFRDIVRRYRIRSVSGLGNLASYLLSNVATEYSYTALTRVSSCQSVHTVKKYMDYLEQAFLFFSVPRFSFKVREQAAFNKKIYCVDNGFISARGFRFSEDRGRLYENLVAIELKKREWNKEISLYFWKSVEQEEVDFAIQKGHRIVSLIQVCSDILEEKTRNREIRALLKAGRELRCNKLIMLTESEERTDELEWFGLRGSIVIMPLWKWLEAAGDSRSDLNHLTED